MSDYKYVSTKPLEEFDVVKKARTSGDLISRQDAIDKILGLTTLNGLIPVSSVIWQINQIPSAESEKDDYCRYQELHSLRNEYER